MNENGKIGNGGAEAVPKDPATLAVIGIDFEHFMVHEGLSFFAFVNSVDLDTGAVISFSFRTPADPPDVHLLPLAHSSLAARMEVLEAPTVTVDTGTQFDAVNRNRNSSNVSTVESIETSPQAGKLTRNGTITGSGTTIFNEVIGGAGPGITGSTGASRNIGEIELKAETVYTVRVTSLVDNNEVQLTLAWYEEG